MAGRVDSLWSLRFDLASAKLLVWLAAVGRDADLRPEAHPYLFDRYSRLAQVYRRRGHEAKARALGAKADEHYRASGSDGPPYAAAMAMLDGFMLGQEAAQPERPRAAIPVPAPSMNGHRVTAPRPVLATAR